MDFLFPGQILLLGDIGSIVQPVLAQAAGTKTSMIRFLGPVRSVCCWESSLMELGKICRNGGNRAVIVH